MTTIFISVQTGMVVRDVLRCGVLDRILCHPDARVVLLTPGVRDPAFVAEFGHNHVSIVSQTAYGPSTTVWRLMLRRWRHARSAPMAELMYRIEERFIHVPAAYTRLLDAYQPSLVVSGDPLRPGDANLIAAARQRGIPSLGSVRSWDNIQKHLRTRPDALTVWNARNAREAVEVDRYRAGQVTQVGAPQLDVYFRPTAPTTSDTTTANASVAAGASTGDARAADAGGVQVDRQVGRRSTGEATMGAPTRSSHNVQANGRPAPPPTSAASVTTEAPAESFATRNRTPAQGHSALTPHNPADITTELGLDPRKKTLLLATSSFTYDSDQTYLVDMLVDAIRGGDIRHPLQIVLRLHPDDRVGRYLKYRRSPEVILDIPERYLATLGWTMTVGDLERMAALMRTADVMVNFATTVTLEAAIVDTPTLLVAFSPIDPDEMQRYVVGLHFKMHYKTLVERDLVPIAWDREQLVTWINRYLDDPGLYREQRASIVREWVQFTDGLSGQRLGDAILRHAGLALPSAPAHRPSDWPCGSR